MVEERAAGGLNERVTGINGNIFGFPANGKAEVKFCLNHQSWQSWQLWQFLKSNG